MSANSDLTIGHIGGNFSNQGGIFAQAGTLTIGAVDGTFVNAGVMGAARLELSNTLSHALENDGALTINGPGSSDIKVALNNAGGAITVAGGALSIDTGNNTVINSGTLTANGGEISIHSTVDNSGGFVQANSGGFVDFNVGISGGSASIEGGKLEYSGWTSSSQYDLQRCRYAGPRPSSTGVFHRGSFPIWLGRHNRSDRPRICTVGDRNVDAEWCWWGS